MTGSSSKMYSGSVTPRGVLVLAVFIIPTGASEIGPGNCILGPTHLHTQGSEIMFLIILSLVFIKFNP